MLWIAHRGLSSQAPENTFPAFEQAIESLEEVLPLIPRNMLLNIEMKNIPSFSEGMERQLNAELVKHNRVKQTIVSSFDHESLYRLKQLNPAVNIGLLFQLRVVNMDAYLRLFSPFTVHSLHPHHSLVRKEEVGDWQARGLEVYPYTVNNSAIAANMEAIGVNGIISDKKIKG
ncbi:glycerophosphodiester phosphodiesterase [Natribacillus halophilus]|uniref:Glycerophosphoryl diester phosphodiesterase family protein n=1 Tax=Natribacillus halophilus TaxID=549003 RepID=A0A1G8MAG6_9BACI|nr:glycerophosphodiester phosphodiesterase [Natribacillus halophilus]SDI64902.1 Glycerophosphoryl diester phosphodiesterase family protein [Natribacillus halophilus]